MKKILLLLLLLLISCSENERTSILETNCSLNWSGQINIKKNNDSDYKEYTINGAFYKSSDQSFIFTKSNEDFNPLYSVQFVIYKPNLNSGNYTHTVYPGNNESFEFRFGANLNIASSPDLNFFTQPNEIKPNTGFLTIEKNSNCFNINYELVTSENDSIKGNYSGGFIKKEEW